MTPSTAHEDALKKILQAQCRAYFTDRTNAHPFFHPIREENQRLFTAQPLPTRKHEAYRYTPLNARLTPLFVEGMPLMERDNDAVAFPPTLLTNLEGHIVTLCNGSLVSQPSPLNAMPFQACSLQEGYAQASNVLHTHFNQQASMAQDPWVYLNGVLFGEGCYVHIPAHTQLAKPLVLDHRVHTSTPASLYPRTLLVVEKGSHATVIETCTTPPLSPPTFVNSVTEIILEEGSHLTYYPLHLDHSPTHQLHYTYVRQAQASCLAQYFTAAPCNDPLLRDQTTVRLSGMHARATLQGMYRSHGAQHLALHTTVHHASPETTTSQHYQGTGGGTSTTLFDGHIHIASGSSQAVANQQHKGWILSEGASIHAVPQLAIETEDVQCRHGTTTVHADPAALTYMQTRGIARDQALAMLRQAFWEPSLQAIPHSGLQNVIRKVLA